MSELDWKDVGIYCVVQLVAGICVGPSVAGMLLRVVNVASAPGFGGWEANLAGSSIPSSSASFS